MKKLFTVVLAAMLMAGCGGPAGPTVAPAVIWPVLEDAGTQDARANMLALFRTTETAKDVVVRLIFREGDGMMYFTVHASNAENKVSNPIQLGGALGWRPVWADCPIEVDHPNRGDYISAIDGGLELRLGDCAAGVHQIRYSPMVSWNPIN